MDTINSIAMFPVEIIEKILFTMPTIQTLVSAILAGPILYHTFKGYEDKILIAVLRNDLGSKVLGLALATELST
ncbi:hypothetical protein N7492_005815 [Penicillium capsulatum]|uniref:Uncharacterized protein n=1 Tax=Penicillium capsulatum TaxID=69766 RepID=A0A9W9IGI5_9EURO|nr:hypothetical protein N7492_005815 [Penicillium capsulatum]KAJ6135085.1 hypothetical protein N7512_000245 [Penicillium capsulatum]